MSISREVLDIKSVLPNENPKCWVVDHVMTKRKEVKEEC